MSWILYHYTLCPFSRIIRVVLKEKGVKFELKLEKYWEHREQFLNISPGAVLPVLFNSDTGNSYSGFYALFEFIEQNFPEHSILPLNYSAQYSARRVTEWFNSKFYDEVTRYLIEEKVLKTIVPGLNANPLNSALIRMAKKNILSHMSYVDSLLKKSGSNYLVSDKVGLADLAAASHFSVLDYINDVPWEYSSKVKSWYALMKSRPSFQEILKETVPGIYRAPHYTDPDF
jgi:glutathione S-transferase